MSSKRRIRRRSCKSKKRFETSEEAKRTLRLYTPGSGYQVYGCKFCGGYHIGRMNRSKRQAMRRKGRMVGSRQGDW